MDSKCLGQHSIFFNVSLKILNSTWDLLTFNLSNFDLYVLKKFVPSFLNLTLK